MAGRDPEDEFREIKREIIESRGLVIKTNNAANALAADIKSIARHQSGFERKLTINSATAYVLFVLLTFGGLKLWLDATIRERDNEIKSLKSQLEKLRSEHTTIARERDERNVLDKRTAAFYEIVRESKRQEAVEAWAQLRGEKLPPAEAAFFQDVVDRFRTDLSVLAYERGLEHARTARYVQAYESFEESVRLRDDGAHIPRVRIAQADVLRHLGRQPEAIVVLQSVIEGADRESAAEAMLLTAKCQADRQQFAEARTTLRNMLRKYAYAPSANDARLLLFNLSTPTPPHH